jgi:hypothetical protein
MNCVFFNKFEINALIEPCTWIDWQDTPHKKMLVDMAVKLNECDDEIKSEWVTDVISNLVDNSIFEASELIKQIGRVICATFPQVSILEIKWLNHYREEVIEIFDNKSHRIQYQDGKTHTFLN